MKSLSRSASATDFSRGSFNEKNCISLASSVSTASSEPGATNRRTFLQRVSETWSGIKNFACSSASRLGEAGGELLHSIKQVPSEIGSYMYNFSSRKNAQLYLLKKDIALYTTNADKGSNYSVKLRVAYAQAALELDVNTQSVISNFSLPPDVVARHVNERRAAARVIISIAKVKERLGTDKVTKIEEELKKIENAFNDRRLSNNEKKTYQEAKDILNSVLKDEGISNAGRDKKIEQAKSLIKQVESFQKGSIHS